MLASLIKLSSILKPHLMETQLTVIIQRRFNSVCDFSLARSVKTSALASGKEVGLETE